MRQRYTHSGRIPPLGPVLGIAIGLAASVPLAFLYDYGIIHVPSVKLRACFSIVFGMLAGAAAGWGLLLGKVRNNRVAAAVGLVVSLGAFYMSWATWLIMIFDKPASYLPGLLARPVAVGRLVALVNIDGTWALSGDSATKGTQLWIIWIMEALLILGFGMLAGFGMIKRGTFCETCDHWCKKAGQLLIMPTMPVPDLVNKLNQGGLEFLAEAKPATKKQPRYTFTWESCPSCGSLNTLKISLTQPKKNKKLASHLVLSASEVELLRNIQGKTQSVALAAAAKA